MAPVELLAAHPGNKRQNLDLSEEFLASIQASGVLVPLRITPDGDGGYRVIEGHRRRAAAVKLGLAEVPYDLVADREGDDAGQYLDMYTTNRHRNALTPTEEADTLFAAKEAGATKTRIRQSTGLKPAQVNTALAAARLSGGTRATVQDSGYDMDLEDLALLAEFEGDPEALARLLDAASYSDSLEHHAERLRIERAEQAEHQRLRAQLEADRLTITDTRPPGAMTLPALRHDGEELTPDTHAACSGHGAYFAAYDLSTPVYYCADPNAHGHTTIWDTPTGQSTDPGSPPDIGSPARPEDPPAPGTSRRVVIEGNRAWKAAAQVRHRWLAETLFPRRTAPREVAPFLARQLLSMPGPLRAGLHLAPGSALFAQLTGQEAGKLLAACGTAPAGRLPLLMLAPIITTYEQAMSEPAGKDTWRPGRYSPCPYGDAGAYLTFLASVGYQHSTIEQNVADGTPYTGDEPANQAPLVRLMDEPTDYSDDSTDQADIPPDQDGTSDQDATEATGSAELSAA